MKKSPLISIKYFFFDFVRFTGLPILLFLRPKKIYISKEARNGFKGGFLMISNHRGFKDPFYLNCCLWTRRQRFITTNEVCSTKWRKFLFKTCFLCIEINRENFSMASFKEITNHLQMGNVVTMFPEGHINFKKEELEQFKSGAVLIAYRANVPIRPVYLEKRKHWYSRLRLYVGEKFYIKDYLKDRPLNTLSVKELSSELQKKEKELELLCLNRTK